MFCNPGRGILLTLLMLPVCASALAQDDRQPSAPVPVAPDSTTPGTFDPLAVGPDSVASGSAGLARPAAAQGPPPTSVEGLGKGTVELIGPWQFHLGDDPAWASPDFDDSQWEQLKADSPWNRQGHEGYSGFAWYRLHFTFTPAPNADPNFALAINRVVDAYEFYLNGVMAGRNGKMPPDPSWYLPNQWTQTYGLGPVRSGVIAFRVWKAPPGQSDSDEGGFWGPPPLVGSPAAIGDYKARVEYLWWRSQMVTLGMISLYAVVAVLGLIAWLRDRQQRYLFWIVVLSLFPGITEILWTLPLSLPFEALNAFSWVLNGVQIVAVYFLLLRVLQLQEEKILVRVTRIAAIVQLTILAISGAESIFGNSSFITSPAGVVFYWLSLLLVPLAFVLLAFAVITRRALDRARWLVAIFVCLELMPGFFRDILWNTSRFTHWTIWKQVLLAPLFAWDGSAVKLEDLAKIATLLCFVYAVYRNSLENRHRQTALEQEFKSARELQQVLIPETLPMVPGFALTSAYRPAQEVGGDFFQIIPLTGESTLIVLGDVSGKGLRAAMTVSLIVGAVHALANEGTNPGRFLFQLNRRLYGRMQGGFVTCIALRVNSAGSCTIASAGHPGPFCNSKEMPLPGSLPLGLTLATSYEDTSFRLSIDDHLSLFTDGLLEATSPSGELFGFERLASLFATNPTATEASEAAVAFGQDDDITVLTLTRLSTGQESTAVYTTLRTLTRPILKEAATLRPKGSTLEL